MPLDAAPSVSVRLACREPFDTAGLLGFLALRAIPGVEHVTADRYTRTVRTTGGSAVIELIPEPGHGQVLLRATLSPAGPVSDLAARQLSARCRRLLDADADPAVIDAALAADDLLAPLVRARPGLRVPGSYDGFELAVRAVLGQQVSVAAARTFAGRLAAQHGPPAPPGSPPGLTALFPGPAELAEADLSRLGLTTSRQRTLRALATAAAAGRLSLDPGADPAETAARLAGLPGIGPWTIGYIMMRAGDPDRFPPGDIGLRRAMTQLGAAPGHDGRWRPWRSYAVIHLWTWETDHA
jgi:AraC family transcriptional regulator, regulatory protein of adaptative response / DNA-3-methyladenine glycosylase II